MPTRPKLWGQSGYVYSNGEPLPETTDPGPDGTGNPYRRLAGSRIGTGNVVGGGLNDYTMPDGRSRWEHLYDIAVRQLRAFEAYATALEDQIAALQASILGLQEELAVCEASHGA